MVNYIDINADLGESFGPWQMGNDSQLLKIVSSANVACGFHGGDPLQMYKTCQRCVDNGVAIGAHPGFRDLVGFGRREIFGCNPDELKAEAIYQIGALKAIAQSAGTKVSHVKFHGALANMASRDEELAKVLFDAVMSVSEHLYVVVIAGTKQQLAAEELGILMIKEIFADRAYNSDGTLVSRAEPKAVIWDPEQCAKNMLEAVNSGCITAINGKKLEIVPETICVHGDGREAINIAQAIRVRLESAGIKIRPFAKQTIRNQSLN